MSFCPQSWLSRKFRDLESLGNVLERSGHRSKNSAQKVVCLWANFALLSRIFLVSVLISIWGFLHTCCQTCNLHLGECQFKIYVSSNQIRSLEFVECNGFSDKFK